jgi:hypothetical protein
MPPNQTGMMKSQKQVQNQFESRMFERMYIKFAALDLRIKS